MSAGEITVNDSKAQNKEAIVLKAFDIPVFKQDSVFHADNPGVTPEQVQAATGWNLKTTDPFTPK
jgi:acyl CoA:acetate/3-ketoacid CoA transferase beta subunit